MIIDVGAYIGLTYRRFRTDFPNATIHAFEPFAPSFTQLQQAMAGDALAHPHPEALAASTGQAKLMVNSAAATNSLLPIDDRAGLHWGEDTLQAQAEMVASTTTLDAFCAQHRINQIDIIKIDVQGFEYSVLQGAESMLKAQQIKLVYLEVIMAPSYQGQHALQDYLALMSRYGYSLQDIFQPIRRDGRLLQFDVMFLPD